MPVVAVVRAQAREQAAIANMFQLYIHDFSELWAGEARGELNESGLFDPYPYLGAYWSEPRCAPLLIRANGHLAGFALINAHFHSGRDADFSMAEFFVVRKHRRGGVGLTAAQQIFAAHRGAWEVAVAARNVGAHRFWARALTPFAPEETVFDTEAWRGPIFRFRAG